MNAQAGPCRHPHLLHIANLSGYVVKSSMGALALLWWCDADWGVLRIGCTCGSWLRDRRDDPRFDLLDEWEDLAI
jgi:hypothetical protein